MIYLNYDSVKRLAQSSSSYSLLEDGEEVEITFTPPSSAEAASVEDQEYVRNVVRIFGTRQGDKVLVKRAVVESEDESRELTEDELEFWAESVNSY